VPTDLAWTPDGATCLSAVSGETRWPIFARSRGKRCGERKPPAKNGKGVKKIGAAVAEISLQAHGKAKSRRRRAMALPDCRAAYRPGPTDDVVGGDSQRRQLVWDLRALLGSDPTRAAPTSNNG